MRETLSLWACSDKLANELPIDLGCTDFALLVVVKGAVGLLHLGSYLCSFDH